MLWKIHRNSQSNELHSNLSMKIECQNRSRDTETAPHGQMHKE